MQHQSGETVGMLRRTMAFSHHCLGGGSASLWGIELVAAPMKVIIACLSPAILAAACATTDYEEPYAVIEAGTRSATRKEIPVLVHSIDGQIPVAGSRYPIPVKPGRHAVDVYFSSGVVAGADEKHRRTLQINAAPCTRYRIVARYTQLTSVEWEPVVYDEPIGGCSSTPRG
jgi:hypothetical protein